MKTSIPMTLTAVLACSLLVAGCGSSSSSSDSGSSNVSTEPVAATLPAPGTPVPASAGSTVLGFLSYLQSLNPNDETSEPSPISNSFAIPDDETGDGLILS